MRATTNDTMTETLEQFANSVIAPLAPAAVEMVEIGKPRRVIDVPDREPVRVPEPAVAPSTPAPAPEPVVAP